MHQHIYYYYKNTTYNHELLLSIMTSFDKVGFTDRLYKNLSTFLNAGHCDPAFTSEI